MADSSFPSSKFACWCNSHTTFPTNHIPALREEALYMIVQIIGGVLGVYAAHFMFAVPVIEASQHVRTGASQWWSEFIATFGLLAVIISTSRNSHESTPVAVAAYITSAYWFTSSTSFANPAVTIARTLTDTFAGIRPLDAPGFIVMQILGAVAAVLVFRWLYVIKDKTEV